MTTPSSPNPPERCATCAYRKGTEANLTPSTTLLATLCEMSGDTFSCHEDGRPCRGWAAEVQRQQVAGERPNEWQRRVAAIMCGEYNDILHEAASGRTIDQDAAFRRICERITSET